MRWPEDQIRAGHIPAEEVPRGVDPRHVTIVHVYRPAAGKAAVVVACTFLAALSLYLTLASLHEVYRVISAAFPVSLGGVTLALRKGKK